MKFQLSICLFLSLVSTWLHASESNLLTLEDAIHLALQENHNHLNLIARSEMSELDYESARSVYKTRFGSRMSSDARSGAEVGSAYGVFLNKDNPSGSKYSAGYYNSTFGDRTLSELRFAYTLPFFRNPLDSKKLAIDQAEINLARSKRLIQIGTEELVNEVVSSYYRLAMSIQSESIAANRMVISQELLTAQEIRFRNGEISELDMAESSLAVSDARQRRDLAHYERQEKEDRLKLLLGIGLNQHITINPELILRIDDALLAMPLEELELQAMGQRTELLAKNEELVMAGKRIRSKTEGILPPMEISLQYALVGEGDRFDDSFQFDDQRFGIGFKMNTDMGNTEKRLRLRKLYLDYSNTQREYEYLLDKVKMDVRSAYFHTRQASSKLDYAVKALDLAKQKHKQSQVLNSRGDLTDLELLQSSQKVADAEHQALSAKVDYILAEQALFMASGYNRSLWNY